MENKSRKICVAVLLAMSICCFLCVYCQKFCFSTMVVADGTQSDQMSVLTLIVNFMNNNMTYISIYLALMTVAFAFMEWIGIRNAKKYEENINGKIAEYRQESDTKIAEYCKKVDDCFKATEEIKANHDLIKKIQSHSNLYMQTINQWMFTSAYNIAQVSDSDSAKDIMNKAFLNYNMMKLYLCDETGEIDECINVIKPKGGEDEIKALQLIVDNDMNKYKKEKAIEAIGYISGRLS